MTNRKPSAAKEPGHAPAEKGEDNNTRLAFLEQQNGLLVGYLTDKHGQTFGEGHASPAETSIALIDQFAEGVSAAHDLAGKDHGRIAAFEASVSSLAIALSGAGIEVAADADPIQLAISVIEGKEEDANHGNATDGEIAAIKRAEEAEARVKVLELEAAEDEEALTEMTNLRNAAINELQAIKEGRDPEKDETDDEEEETAVAPPPRTRPEGARDFGPTFGQATAEEIAEVITEGSAELELAFSNGQHELVALAPVPIEGAALIYRGRQFHVEPAIHVRGAGYAEDLHGVALLLNGEQFAYCQFPEPQGLEPGQERKLERMIVFG